MFISDLAIGLPGSSSPLNNGDNELRDIKLAIKSTFKNFVSSQLNYSPIELLGMYKFITADATNLLWSGSVPGRDNVYVIAVTESKVLYARAPKPMWGTVIYSQFNQDQMNVFYPNTYRLLDGSPISGTLLNRIINAPVLESTNLKNLPNMTNNYIRGIGGFNTLLQILPESVKLTNTQMTFSFQASAGTLAAATHRHGTDDAYFNDSPASCSIAKADFTDGELDEAATYNGTSLVKDIHAHNFAAGTSTSTIGTPTESTDTTGIGAKKVIRPTTYNLYAYTRVN